MSAAVTGLLIGAAIGSVPFAWVLYRLITGRDLRDEGSGNPGATNLERSAGTAAGAAALLLDAGKGAAAVLIAGRLAGGVADVPAAAGAVVGHVFSPWLSGRGGKGVATTAGAYAVIAPTATSVAVGVFALVAGVTRFVSAGSVAGACVLPAAVLVFGPGGRAALLAAAIALLIAWRHRRNFARMRDGTEPRLARRVRGPGDASR